MNNNFYIKLSAFILLFMSVFNGALSQSLKLNEAIEKRNIGDFTESNNLLKLELKNNIDDENTRIEIYKILSENYIEMDSISIAKNCIAEILKIESNYKSQVYDTYLFKKLLSEIKNYSSTPKVVSVSKNSENLYEAPATVISIDEDEISKKGYSNLIEIMNDLPGFDITTGLGFIYSNVYMRGYRSKSTDRMLLLVDGVEQNDLWGNIAFISRQYPISNIKSVEVVYGPISTIYGANAFLGVISVITKSFNDYNISVDRYFSPNLSFEYGYNNTRSIDINLPFRTNNKNINGIISIRHFESDEQDFSEFESYDYKIDELNSNNYSESLSVNIDETELYNDIISSVPSNYYSIDINDSIITPSSYAISQAYEKDSDLYAQTSFLNPTKSFFIQSKFKLFNFNIDFQHWNKSEGGGGWYEDNYAGPNSKWAPYNTSFSLKYDKDISSKLSFSNFLRFKENGIGTETGLERYNTYENGALNLINLHENDDSYFSFLYYHLRSNQIRNETKFSYKNKNLSIFTGFELRSSFIQGSYLSSYEFTAEENAIVNSSDLGGNYYSSKDIGYYLETNYKLKTNLNFISGARIDYNKIRQNGGYGYSFNPRFCLVYADSIKVLKLMYSEAFKDASNYDKFAIFGNRIENNPVLQPEKVKNYEISYRKFIDANKYNNIEIIAYNSFYSGAVGEVVINSSGNTQNQNLGNRNIQGIYSILNLHRGNLKYKFMYSYIIPKEEKSESSEYVRIADISTHQFKSSLLYEIKKNIDLSLNYNFYSERITGSETNNENNQNEFPAYNVVNAVLNWDLKRDNSKLLKLKVNNLLNVNYFSPGVRTGGGIAYSQMIPQQKRFFSLNLTFNM